jgi:glycosyltransferase involved in cell wall biosynthesis
VPHFALDARAAARPELGGVERWARELAARLPALGRWEVLAPRPRLVHRAGHAWEQTALPFRARAADALLCPANVAPLAYRRTVVVIHDTAPLRRPEWYSRPYVAWQRALLPRLARRALHVLTVSEFSRAELIELLGLAPDRVGVVPGGVGEQFRPDAAPARRERPYLLCVSSHTARKNLVALGEVARRTGLEVVVAGGHRPQFAAESGLEALTLLGHVGEEELPGLYAGAEAFVLPSAYEGFGLPVLEAMACGTPVVCTDAGALPQTAGGAARVVTAEDLAEAVGELLEDAAERERLREAGLRRAARFDWDATARAVHEAVSAAAAPRVRSAGSA